MGSASALTQGPAPLTISTFTSLLFVGRVVEAKAGALWSSRFPKPRRSRHRPHRQYMASILAAYACSRNSASASWSRQFLVPGVKLALDQVELLDGFDPREVGVAALDLALIKS